MSDLSDFMKEQITEEQAAKGAKIIFAVFDLADADEKAELMERMIKQYDNAIHNVTLLKTALEKELSTSNDLSNLQPRN